MKWFKKENYTIIGNKNYTVDMFYPDNIAMSFSTKNSNYLFIKDREKTNEDIPLIIGDLYKIEDNRPLLISKNAELETVKEGERASFRCENGKTFSSSFVQNAVSYENLSDIGGMDLREFLSTSMKENEGILLQTKNSNYVVVPEYSRLSLNNVFAFVYKENKEGIYERIGSHCAIGSISLNNRCYLSGEDSTILISSLQNIETIDLDEIGIGKEIEAEREEIEY